MKKRMISISIALLACLGAQAEESRWTLRFHGAVVQSSAPESSLTASGGTFRVDGTSQGLGLGAEYRVSDRVGVELSTLFTGLDIGMQVSPWSSSSLELSMVPVMLSVPVHFPVGRQTDIYVAPTIGHVTYHNARMSLGPWKASTDVEIGSDTALGATVGLDIDIGQRRKWALSTGLRYLETSADGTAVDPLIVTLGFAYRF